MYHNNHAIKIQNIMFKFHRDDADDRRVWFRSATRVSSLPRCEHCGSHSTLYFEELTKFYSTQILYKHCIFNIVSALGS